MSDLTDEQRAAAMELVRTVQTIIAERDAALEMHRVQFDRAERSAAECDQLRAEAARVDQVNDAALRVLAKQVAAVRDVIRRAQAISPSLSMHVYVADLLAALGEDAPRPHKLGGGDA